MADMKDAIERMEELFTEALEGAEQNYRAAIQAETDSAAADAAEDAGEYDWSDFDEDSIEFSRRFSLRDVKAPSREELEKKPPMKVVDISAPQTGGSFAQRRRQILVAAEEIMKKPYLNRDTGAMIFLTPKSYTHVFSNPGEVQINAAEHLPELIENAVLVHREDPDHGSEYADGVYTFFAAGKTDSIVPVKLKVKEYAYRGQLLPKNIRDYFGSDPGDYASSYDTVVLEVEEIEESPSGSVGDSAKRRIAPDPNELSEIRVTDLLDLVKGDARKYIPSSAKLSERDSEGRKLTREQQKFFKDSKVRDADGNLLVMYHGTSSGGHTVFEPYSKANYGLFGAGVYFTDNKSVAKSYTTKGKGSNETVYEVYLNIVNPIDMDADADPTAWRKALPDADFPESGSNETFFRAMEDYFVEEQYTKWEAKEAAMEIIEGMGYDGITHIGGGRFLKNDPTRHRVFIAFASEQVKNVDNKKPTNNPDIRFSQRDPAAQRLNQALEKENAAQAEEIKYLRELVRLQGIVSELKIPQKHGMQTMGMLTFNQIGV